MIIEALLHGGKNMIKYNSFITYETQQHIDECLYSHHIDLEAFFLKIILLIFVKYSYLLGRKNKELLYVF